MPQVLLNDALFAAVRERAAQTGFATVDDFVSDVLRDELNGEDSLPVDFFTPERMAELEQAAASIRAGHGLTPEQLDAELARRRAEWLKLKGL